MGDYDRVAHVPSVDYIRASTTSFFAPSRELVRLDDIVEYKEQVLNEVTEYLGLTTIDYAITRAGHYGYKSVVPIISGIALYILPHTANMGTCLQISGAGMTSLRYAGWNDLEIVRKLYVDNFRFSRLDVCIDTYGGYSVGDCVRQAASIEGHSGRYVKSRYMVDMETGADTLYFGTRSGYMLGRIYAKSLFENEVEQRVRYEMEYGKHKAKWAVSVLCQMGYAGIVWDMLDFAGFGGVANFPNGDTIDLDIPPMRRAPKGDSGSGEWVAKCKKAIAAGIMEIGIVNFEYMMVSQLGFNPFDKVRE